MKIVFLGTPDFSVPTLNALVNSKHSVLAVVTQPDKKRDRNVESFSPVKDCALEHGLKVLQYEKIRAEGVEDLKKLNPDMMVTCAYGQIISQEILDIPKYGVINVHASLLPKYRGSSPIQWAVINGEKETGITIMKTALGVDSGDIILQKHVEIRKHETAGELFDRLATIAPEVLLEAISEIENGTAIYLKQNDEESTHYPMLSKENGKIDWSLDNTVIENKIYGMNPWPSAYTTYQSKMFKIWNATSVELGDNTLETGSIIFIDGQPVVKCGKGGLALETIQLEGKKRMSIKDFMLGNKMKEGEKLI